MVVKFYVSFQADGDTGPFFLLIKKNAQSLFTLAGKSQFTVVTKSKTCFDYLND